MLGMNSFVKILAESWKGIRSDNDYHLHITTCVEAIKPRQIINYDAGIVLIDLHQLNVKTTSDNTNQRH